MKVPGKGVVSHTAGIVMLLAAVTVLSAAQTVSAADDGLLFYLSGEKGFQADYAAGRAEPTFLNGVEIVSDGARGKGFSMAHFSQLFAYDAPGNMYAERGTLSFYWRPRDPVGKTPFILVQVGPSDHSDLIMNFMRIDYNGEGGIDAYVSDINLGLARVSYKSSTLPEAKKWYHIAFTWDETKGVRLYFDGALVGKKDTTAVFYSGLDQFGTGCRGITPHYVGSEGNFIRGGDFDEFQIYDRMLTDDQVARLSKGDVIKGLEPVVRDLGDPVWRDEWRLRYGWNRPGDTPPALVGRDVAVRKVELTDVYDLKQWYWKGTDGIRETTWPGVYNRSRLTGRHDYFVQPDWNCYSLSGKSVTYTVPDSEAWNHVEIAGAAYGSASFIDYDRETQAPAATKLFTRPIHQERTVNRLDRDRTGGKIRFDNDAQETPIGEFMLYHVTQGSPPEGITTLSYAIRGGVVPDNPSLAPLVEFIGRRYLPDEASIAMALPSGAPTRPAEKRAAKPLPLVHVLIPFEFRNMDFATLGWYDNPNPPRSYTWENIYGGLDGIAIDIPALNVKATHDGLFPMNVRILDPVWPDRTLMDFTFSVKPGEPHTLWLDTRDRVLPNGYPLYLTIAGAGQDFDAADLEGAAVRLVFKEYDDAAKEHVADRFIQVKDNASHFVEPGANSKKYRIYNRFSEDMQDLFRVDPHHELGRAYWYWKNPEQSRPPFVQKEPPAGVPLWAFRQIEHLKLLRHYVNWWIDERQIENGEFGGGLSDDGDLTPQFIGPALMGVDTDKITDSIRREMNAFFENGMITDGMPTIQTDELHTYEEGLQMLSQDMQLRFGDPVAVERLMDTARAYERITAVNSAGHRHIRSSFYSATKIADEGVWAYSYPYSYLIFHAGVSLVDYNGNPRAKKLLLEMADGLLAHRKKDERGNWYFESKIHLTDDTGTGRGIGPAVHLLWAAWRWTGDRKYLDPIIYDGPGVMNTLNGDIMDVAGVRDTWRDQILSRTTPHSGGSLNRHLAWMLTGDKQYLEEYYADDIAQCSRMMYIYTEGHFWTDRVSMPTRELQRSRLGGVAAMRSTLYTGNAVSWRFEAPHDGEDVAILVPVSSDDRLKIVAFNLRRDAVPATMTGWNVAPGEWEMTVGTDADGDDTIDKPSRPEKVTFERSRSLDVVFQPRTTTVIEMKRVKKGVPLWNRPDLGIGVETVRMSGSTVRATVHNLGSVDSGETAIAVVDASGKIVASSAIPPIKAPVDLESKTADVTLSLPSGVSAAGLKLVIDPEEKVSELTRLNNAVSLGGK